MELGPVYDWWTKQAVVQYRNGVSLRIMGKFMFDLTERDDIPADVRATAEGILTDLVRLSEQETA